MVESFSPSSDAEILSSLHWPHEQLSNEKLDWIIAPWIDYQTPLPGQPRGVGIAALMIEETHQMFSDMNGQETEITRQAITNGFVKMTHILSSRINSPQMLGLEAEKFLPPDMFLEIMLEDKNLSFAERLGLTEGTRRFMEIQNQVVEYKATSAALPVNSPLTELAA